MVDISESAAWRSVTRIEPTTIALGGDEVNAPNLQFKQLVDRTKWLKEQVESGTGYSAFRYSITQNNHGLSEKDPVYFNGTLWVKSDASLPETSIAIGLITDVTGEDSFVLSVGFCDNLYGFTPGAIYYVSDEGGLSLTPGTVEFPVFYATSTTSGWFGTVAGLAINTGAGGGGGGGTAVTKYSTVIALGG